MCSTKVRPRNLCLFSSYLPAQSAHSFRKDSRRKSTSHVARIEAGRRLNASRALGDGVSRRESISIKSSAKLDESSKLYSWSRMMMDRGVWAEVKIGGEHLSLFSEQGPAGVQASVYNVKAKTWVAPSEVVDDIEQGKDRAAAHAQCYLRQTADLELPSLKWRQSRSV